MRKRRRKEIVKQEEEKKGEHENRDSAKSLAHLIPPSLYLRSCNREPTILSRFRAVDAENNNNNNNKITILKRQKTRSQDSGIKKAGTMRRKDQSASSQQPTILQYFFDLKNSHPKGASRSIFSKY